MKKIITPAFFFLITVGALQAQTNKITKATIGASSLVATQTKSTQQFVSVHKEKDSPFEIYQDLINDDLVIRLKNQFDVLRFEIRDAQGNTMNVKGKQDKSEVHADLKGLVNGRYQLVVDRNNEKIFTEFFLER